MKRKIENLRDTLYGLVQQYGTSDARVIRKSQMLDKIIVQYMQSLSGNKPKPHKDDSIRELHGHFESIILLYEEIEGLENEMASLSDPMVLHKFRVLDSMIIAYIRR